MSFLKNYRIISNNQDFKVQKRVFPFIPIWATIQRAEDLDNKDFGGDKSFKNKKEAQNFIDKQEEKKYKVIK